jgi:GTP-sensing pleiotropic transcriptional regulator CodY
MTPTIVQFVIEGNVVELTEIPNIYNSTDLVVVGFSSFVLGSSLVYLLLVDKNKDLRTKISLVKEKWDKLLGELSDPDEKIIVRIIIDDGGTIFQSQLVEKSGFSKSKVSLNLDKLEARRILERKRRGMTNVVVLK